MIFLLFFLFFHYFVRFVCFIVYFVSIMVLNNKIKNRNKICWLTTPTLFLVNFWTWSSICLDPGFACIIFRKNLFAKESNLLMNASTLLRNRVVVFFCHRKMFFLWKNDKLNWTRNDFSHLQTWTMIGQFCG